MSLPNKSIKPALIITGVFFTTVFLAAWKVVDLFYALFTATMCP